MTINTIDIWLMSSEWLNNLWLIRVNYIYMAVIRNSYEKLIVWGKCEISYNFPMNIQEVHLIALILIEYQNISNVVPNSQKILFLCLKLQTLTK